MCNKYNHFACPNPACSLYNQFCEGNIAHYSWIGKAKNIERLQCKKCFRAFSSRRGTLLEAAKISELQQTRLLKCFRWGVSDEGTADIAEVDVKTVRLFREKAAKRAQIHHDCGVVYRLRAVNFCLQPDLQPFQGRAGAR